MTRILLKNRRGTLAILFNCKYSTAPNSKAVIKVKDRDYIADDYTNVTPKILSKLGRNLHLQNDNPLSIVRQRIVNFFYASFTHSGNPSFSIYDNLAPIVSTKQNFDDLLIPMDHPSRAKSDCYYINKETLLRTRMTAHQCELIKAGLDNFLMIGDVYRRCEIDSTHFPVFHQVDAVRCQRRDDLFPDKPDLEIFEATYNQSSPNTFKNSISDPNKQSCHTLEATKLMEHQLKSHVLGLVKSLFEEDVKYRWVDAHFPFTHPSWELEIGYETKWMKVLSCGIVRNEILLNAGATHTIAYAFGLGLERLAMALYKIPDIRLMWSTDSGFTSQFQGKDVNEKITYEPVSQDFQSTRHISFWLPVNLSVDTNINNDFFDLVRNVGADIIEDVKLFDKFVHPISKKHCLTYSIVYRHPERTLRKAEINEIHKNIEKAATDTLQVVIR